jgi:hypothetical protein
MKKLLIILLFIANVAVAQTEADTVTISSNPTYLSLGDTDITMIEFTKGTYKDNVPVPLYLMLRFPSGNAGTVQVSTYGSTVTSSPAFAAGSYVIITVYKKVWIKLSNSADDVEISW